MKLCIIILLVLAFVFGLYTLCADILWTVKIAEETVPSVFARLVREGYELPLTIVSFLLLANVVGALARRNREWFSKLWKNTGFCLKSGWVGALILSGIIVLVGRFCERYGLIDQVCSTFLMDCALNTKDKWLVLSWTYRLLSLLNGELLLLIFIRSNHLLTISLLVVYFVFGSLLMLGSPPVVYLPDQMLNKSPLQVTEGSTGEPVLRE